MRRNLSSKKRTIRKTRRKDEDKEEGEEIAAHYVFTIRFFTFCENIFIPVPYIYADSMSVFLATINTMKNFGRYQ